MSAPRSRSSHKAEEKIDKSSHEYLLSSNGYKNAVKAESSTIPSESFNSSHHNMSNTDAVSEAAQRTYASVVRQHRSYVAAPSQQQLKGGGPKAILIDESSSSSSS
eukprot:PhM_4_TR5922/c2_g4_i2/m.11508